MNDRFSQFHPIVNLTFYVAVIAFTMFLMNPVCLGMSLCCALANAIYLNGVKTVRFGIRIVLPTVILVSVINPRDDFRLIHLFIRQDHSVAEFGFIYGASVCAAFPDGIPADTRSTKTAVSCGTQRLFLVAETSCP